MDDPTSPPPALPLDGHPSDVAPWAKVPSDDAPVDGLDAAAELPGDASRPADPAAVRSAPPSAGSSSSPLSSVSSDSDAGEPAAAGRRSQVRWAAAAAPDGPVGAPEDLCQLLVDPLVYDATRAMVGAVLRRAAQLLQDEALSTAAELLRRVLAAALRQLTTASASVHRLLPLGLRLAEHVMTVSQWRAVEARSRSCARRVIYQALLELQLSQERREARRLLRALRRRPGRLWADVSLEEAAAELASRRPPDLPPGLEPARDAGRETEAALLAAYRAAARAGLTEPVPAVPLPPAAGLDAAARLAAVHEVIRSWRYSVRWRYCVDFLRTKEEPLLSRHVYQVRFSVPEQHQPIPRPVAYVFFVLTVSKVRPAYEPIQMCYMVETSRLRHVPGKVVFQEKWLIDVINAKLMFWRDINF